ncbi:HNH endonuclease [Planifilum fimeticola]|uniref:HNH endonuclease n=1 Tax=Planifilum fimeticola TaxID=201975 RepID=A0A2T0L9R5_9BACL|nr:HNH endonuclease signature motif containing protein [Planifilum fimeticola]PRX38477.1 HNH endonuclease [Planifilum fimeticola]
MGKRSSSPSKAAIVDAWKDWLEWDLDEPRCFACDKPAYSDYRGNNYRKRWEQAHLEKAHIIPHALSGPNTPDNYFLLCSECHRLAPTTAYREDFLKWAKAQNYITRRLETIRSELNTFLSDPKEQEQFFKWSSHLSYDDLKDMLSKHKDLFTTHGSSMPASTFVAMLVRIWREQTAS